jgi:hypothetical protein
MQTCSKKRLEVQLQDDGLATPIAATATFVSVTIYMYATLAASATLDDYCDERLKLLAHVPHANPRFSKLAFGRLAWFPLLSEPWDRLSAWTVFFARRLQLARQAERVAHQRRLKPFEGRPDELAAVGPGLGNGRVQTWGFHAVLPG